MRNYINIEIKRNKCITIGDKTFCPDGRYERKFIIEFNGTNIHFDNRFFSSSDKNFTGKTFNDIHEYDELKYNSFIQAGYFVYIIWEYDYKKHKNELLKLLAEEIENENYKEDTIWDSARFFNKCPEQS